MSDVISYEQTAKDFGKAGYSSSDLREQRRLNALLKIYRTPQEIATSKLYSELGNYSSENITKELRAYIVSQYENMSQLSHMNMKVFAAAVVMKHIIEMGSNKSSFAEMITYDNFHTTFKLYIQNKFIPLSSMDKTEYYTKLKIDILRYLRTINFYKS